MVSTGPIERGVIYPLPEFLRRTGFSKATMRTARRNGLQVRRVGKFSFIDGEAFIQFVNARGRIVGINGELLESPTGAAS